jgi:hypothetical protein
MRRNKPLAAHWRDILEKRGNVEHPKYPLDWWRDMVANDDTRLGYADTVARYMFEDHVKTPLPAGLTQFKPKGKWTSAAKEAVVKSFEANHVQYDADPRGPLWFVMEHCFENLIPFVVLKMGGEFAVAEDSKQLREELEGADAELLYESDATVVPRYTDLRS